MRERRRALTAGQRTLASARLCRRIARHPDFIRAARVGFYFPNDGEIDPIGLAYPASGRRFFLPVLPPRGLRLWFSLYRPGDRLVADRFGIPEPATRVRIRAERLDLLLVPLVAFDGTGGRVGMGGGFYDTTLSFLSGAARVRPLRAYGVAYQFQQIETIPCEAWDVPLHGVFTDLAFIGPQFSPGGAEALSLSPSI